jgi:hypothetical protein
MPFPDLASLDPGCIRGCIHRNQTDARMQRIANFALCGHCAYRFALVIMLLTCRKVRG